MCRVLLWSLGLYCIYYLGCHSDVIPGVWLMRALLWNVGLAVLQRRPMPSVWLTFRGHNLVGSIGSLETGLNNLGFTFPIWKIG